MGGKMKKELEQKLYKKYPKIFVQRKLDMSKTSMCFGLQCGDGWYDLIDKVCGYLQFQIDNNGMPQFSFNTVKEKFGSLRLYTDGWNSELDNVISFAEYLSQFICEECGQPGKIGGQILILCRCDKCRKAMRKEI